MYKKLFKSIREYKKQSLLSIIFTAMSLLSEISLPFLMANLIDNGILKNDLNYVYKIGGLIFILITCAMLCGLQGGKYAAYASTGFAKNLRQDLFEKIQTFSFENIDKFQTASLITRLTTDINNIQMAYQMIIRTFIRAPLALGFALFMSVNLSKSLSLLFAAIVPIMGFFLIAIVNVVHPIFVKIFERYDKFNLNIQENINAIRVVKTFVREKFEIDKFKESSDELKEGFSKAERILALNGPVIQGTMYIANLVIIWNGTKLAINGTMTPGELSSFMIYLIQILVALMLISNVYVMVVISKRSVERSIEILDEEVILKNRDNPVFKVADGKIEFQNVCFKYHEHNKHYLFDKINFKINSGETVGIIGGTGSGKSSLIQLISRLYDINEGSVKVGSVDVKDYDLQTLRDNVAVVLQKNTLFSGTIKENLKWGNMDATDEEIIRICKLAQAYEFIEKLPDKYDYKLDKGGTNVSGGQRQRLCIARALLKNPKILILDDSTSALDTKTDALVLEAFRNEIPDITKIIIAQRITSVMNADKIIVMDDGIITGIGTHDELLKNNEIYKDVHLSQQKGALSDV